MRSFSLLKIAETLKSQYPTNDLEGANRADYSDFCKVREVWQVSFVKKIKIFTEN